MLSIILLLLLILVSLYIIIKFNSNPIEKKVDTSKRLSSCELYKYLIVPGGLDWSVQVIEDFVSDSEDIDIISDEQLKLQIVDANDKNLPIVWVYNPFENSGKFWMNFGSVKHRQITSDLRRLCLTTIIKHFPEYHFRIVVFNQDNLLSLIPKYYRFCKPLYPYLQNEFIKYAILETYGGYWVPIDTVIMQSITNTLTDYYNGKLIVNGFVSTQYKDIFSYSSVYIGCQKKHPIIMEMVRYIMEHANSFQNAVQFKDGVHKYFQIVCEQYISMIARYNLVSFTNRKYEMLSFEDLYSQNNNMPPLNDLYIIPTLYEDVMKKHMFNYIERMSTKQLLESEMWLTNAIQVSLK
jgi:hypothetical protein